MSMESRMCMNSCCRATSTVQWKKGWPTKSGQPALLCFNCGCLASSSPLPSIYLFVYLFIRLSSRSAYDNFLYCHTFHAHQSGWRECSLCNKRLHCGCSASLPFLDILDFGGVSCITCLHPSPPPLANSVIPDGISSQPQPQPQTPTNHTNTTHLHNSLMATNLDSPNKATGNILHLGTIIDPILPRFLPQTHADPTNTNTSQGTLPIPLPLLYTQPTQDKNIADPKIMQGPQIPSLNMSLHSPSETSNPPLSFSNGVEEDKSRPTQPHSGQKRHLFPKPPKTNPAKVSNANKTPSSPMRVARPPAEGRLRNQLLPRYWPRITDQELQKLSGDLNTAIVPLFEKILSASDASRIGRLVLPKACAEAYFPPINQSEGLPLKIQDVKGNEWAFQFRFWPNNNSRMYVLEGVTPCIQSMQLQAGDTVTFSRIDPGGKLVIGYRKASNTLEIQDSQTSLVNSSSPPSGECLYPGVADGLAVGNILLGIQPLRAQDDHPNILPGKLEMVKGETILNKCEKLSIKNENALQQPELTPEKKRTRNISSKSKRLIMHSEDAVELRLSWEETQELLRPPPSLEPNIVMVDDIEFEEYSDPPVFGKKTYFTSRLCGVKDQWAQCDKCSKWRKLPADVLLPPMWTCLENIWDSSRSSCDTSEEMSSVELEIIFRINKDFKKGKAAAEIPKLGHGCEPSGLDALATAATLSDHTEGSGGTTTRHPRHRPGCSCIVCIQPPSGKGKHKSSCVCNVCLTVKRRFKTLMMRKKKRQGEREAELALRKSHPIKKPRLLKNTSVDCGMSDKVCLENDFQEKLESEDKGHIDLNCHPTREEEPKVVMQPNAEMVNSNELGNLLPKQQPTDDGSSSKEKCDTLTVVMEQEGDDHGSKKGTSN